MHVPNNGSVEVDLLNARSGTSQPGFCCYRSEYPGGPGPGTQAEAVVWLKTIGPESGHLLVNTCNTTAGGGDDSIIQVLAVGDLDSGLCEDGLACSVAQQNCADGSECVLDEYQACDRLLPIGCSDDAEFEGSTCSNGTTGFPSNSMLCVDVVPGDPYYIMVGAKDEEARGVYRVTVSEFCTPDAPTLPNDLCSNAPILDPGHAQCDASGDCTVPFDLSGNGGGFASATFDCPGPQCLSTMQNDIWYDWIAPATGRVSVETCDGPNTPNTSLVIYRGCDCPIEFGTELDCGENLIAPGCLLGSRVTAAVQHGECYKLRLGGRLGSTPSGTLKIDFNACPHGSITAIHPTNQTIDARAPLDPATQEPLGIDSFTIHWPDGSTEPFCYSYCETLVDGFAANLIFGPITDHGNDVFTVNLARPLAPGASGVLTALHGDGSVSTVTVASLPADADGSGSVDMNDLDFLVAELNKPASFDKYRHDMDHSLGFTPRDLLRWLDLAAGIPGAFDPWLKHTAPDCSACCPN